MTALARGNSIRNLLLRLLAVAFIPLVLLLAFFVWRYADSERRIIESRRFDTVNNLTFLLDAEVRSVRATIETLAASPTLQANDLPAFHTYARNFVGSRIALIALLQPSGQQALSTAVPFGEALPIRPDMTLFADVLAGKSMVSDVVVGSLLKRPLISVAVPVLREGVVAYVMSAVLFPERFLPLFAEAGVNPSWAAAVVDRQGRFVTRNIRPEATLGQMARPELGAVARGLDDEGEFFNTTLEGVKTGNSFKRSKVTGWTAVVAVPTNVLYAPYRSALWWIIAGITAVVALSLFLASSISAQISRTISSFGDAATALVNERDLPETPEYISELAAVRQAFRHAEDVASARARADKRVRELLHEMAHRSKNLLAVVEGIARQSAQLAVTPAEFNMRFAERLHSLAATHSLLTTENWEAVPLARLAAEQLAPFADASRVTFDFLPVGVTFSPTVTQSIGMAFHELATNATKYGALSNATGSIALTSRIDQTQADAPLILRWIEQGGPRVDTAPTRKGFGQFVTGRMVAHAVDGKAETNYAPEGLVWTLVIANSHYSITNDDASSGRKPK
jgi:two-component sensor histidine kinase